MAINPLEILEFAEQNCQSDSEAVLRSSVSRAYYAVYHKALEYAKHRSIYTKPEEKTSVHWHLIVTINKVDRLLAKRLHKLRDQRNRADYSIGGSYLSKREVSLQIDSSKRLFNVFDKVINDKAN